VVTQRQVVGLFNKGHGFDSLQTELAAVMTRGKLFTPLSPVIKQYITRYQSMGGDAVWLGR